MPRLLSVINNPVFGGAHNELIMQQEGLASHGWETLALTTDEPAAQRAAERLRTSGVETITMPLHRLRASPDVRLHWGLVRGWRREVRAIREILRTRGIDVVQVHGPTNPHGAVAAHREGVAVNWEIYDTVAPPPLVRASMPMVVRLADTITTWGRALGEAHPPTPSFGERWVVVHPPVDFERFHFTPERRAAARAELGVGDADIVLGTVGNRNPSKGHEHVIDAVALLAERHPGLRLRVMGGVSPAHAAYEASLHAAIARHGLGDRVTLLEPGGRVAELVPGLDVFVMGSVPRSEGMPTVILEAMACGIPAVATDVGAVRELIDDGVTGRVVPPLDARVIAAALEPLVADAALRGRMGQAGLARALEHFTLEQVVSKRVRAYELALRHRAAR